jgi:hypothetical protein
VAHGIYTCAVAVPCRGPPLNEAALADCVRTEAGGDAVLWPGQPLVVVLSSETPPLRQQHLVLWAPHQWRRDEVPPGAIWPDTDLPLAQDMPWLHTDPVSVCKRLLDDARARVLRLPTVSHAEAWVTTVWPRAAARQPDAHALLVTRGRAPVHPARRYKLGLWLRGASRDVTERIAWLPVDDCPADWAPGLALVVVDGTDAGAHLRAAEWVQLIDYAIGVARRVVFVLVGHPPPHASAPIWFGI